MASLQISIRSAALRKDGTANIRFTLSHRNKVAYIPTPFYVLPSQFKGGRVVRRADALLMNTKIQGLYERYYAAIMSIPYQSAIDCMTLKQKIMHIVEGENMMASEWFAKYIESQKGVLVGASIRALTLCARRFTDFYGEMPLAAITPSTIADYAKWLESNGREDGTGKLSDAYFSITMMRLKSMISAAIKQGVVKYDQHPFTDFESKRRYARHCVVSERTIRAIMNLRTDCRPKAVARDIFMLSFYTGGTNLIDLLQADFRGEVFSFVRSKTKRRCRDTVTIPIIPQARKIIDKYIKEDGRLDFGYNFCRSENYISWEGRQLRFIREMLGLEDCLCFYSARKTFAQTALDLGVSDAVVNAALGHANTTRGVISYYSRVRPKQIGEALILTAKHIEKGDS